MNIINYVDEYIFSNLSAYLINYNTKKGIIKYFTL